MPQIDFYVLSQLSTLVLSLTLALVFILVHVTFLRAWLDASIRISFLMSLLNELKIIRTLVTEASLPIFLSSDFLEQFLIVLISCSAAALGFYLFISFCLTLFSELVSSILLSVLRGVLFSYSTFEFLYLRKFAPFFLASLIIIFFFNLVGMIPNAFTFTSSLSVPFFFGLVTFYLWFIAIFLFNPAKAMSFFLHNGTNFFISPLIALIEIISNFSKFISLAVRLFANMFAGHLLLKAFYSFIFILVLNASLINMIFGVFVLAFTFFIISLEFLIAFLQAYVALLLMVLYLSGMRLFSYEH